MLSKKMEKALGDQINAESQSAYLYLSLAGWFETQNLPGFAHWMTIQAQEELMHMKKLFDYVYQRGGRVNLGTVSAPPSEWKDVLDAFTVVFNHEDHITQRINKLVDVALAEKDHATNSLLQWFVAEQIEEMKTAQDIVSKLKLLGGTGAGLFMLDRDMATRALVTTPGPGA